MKAYAVKGTTDDITVCELCGRDELKGTVILVPLDADGNPDGEPMYFGTSCAAKAAGWTTKEVTRRVKAAKDEEREREAAERAARWEEARAPYLAWLKETYGTDDQAAVIKAQGYRTARPLSEQYDAYRATV